MATDETEIDEMLARSHGRTIVRDARGEDVRLYGGFDIMADSGRSLYHIRVSADGALEIATGGQTGVKHGGVLLDSTLTIKPCDGGRVVIRREVYEG